MILEITHAFQNLLLLLLITELRLSDCRPCRWRARLRSTLNVLYTSHLWLQVSFLKEKSLKFNSWRTRLFDKWESNVEGWMQEFVHLFDAPRRRLRDLLDAASSSGGEDADPLGLFHDRNTNIISLVEQKFCVRTYQRVGALVTF